MPDRRDHDHERRDGLAVPEPTKIRLSGTLVIQIVTWTVAALLTYGAVNARVAVLESRVDGLKNDVQEIKGDVKTLLLRGP